MTAWLIVHVGCDDCATQVVGLRGEESSQVRHRAQQAGWSTERDHGFGVRDFCAPCSARRLAERMREAS